jgi:riboflavin kinase/FMN adenylyltransferase
VEVWRNHIGRRDRKRIAALGNFDGVHRGHQSILTRALERARASDGLALAITFDPHPLKVLAPHLDLRFLTGFEEKMRLLAEVGLDAALCLEFTSEFARQSPDEFVRRVLAEEVGATAVFVGENFAFGKGRSGTVRDLVRLGRDLGFEVEVVPTLSVDGAAVSSSRIRDALLRGDVTTAAQLLGRPYALEETVVHGANRGKGLGFPTANLRPPRERVVPLDGIYATMAVVDGRRLESVTYIGGRPTFGAGERFVEVHLLQGAADLYNRRLRVEFIGWIRGDQTFTDPVALARQIGEDVAAARRLLAVSADPGGAVTQSRTKT